MRPGQSAGLWLPNGRFVTRWKEQRPSANNAVIGESVEQLREVLRRKFAPHILKNIGAFEFSGWADQQEADVVEERSMMPEPVVALASVLSKAEIASRLKEIIEMIEQSPDEGSLWCEIFVRSRTPVQDEDIRRRHKPKPRGSRREYRRD